MATVQGMGQCKTGDMGYEIVVREENGYLHVRVTGDNSLDNVRGYFRSALQACARLGHANLLIEENLQGRRLSVADIFHVTVELVEQSRLILRRLAYVDVNPDRSMENTRFAETVAVNRGISMRVFETLDEARAWLTHSAGAGTSNGQSVKGYNSANV